MMKRSGKRSTLALVAVTLVAVAGLGLYGQGQTQNQATGPARSRAEETQRLVNLPQGVALVTTHRQGI
jgi:uncharacterized protein HemX